jgi:hypothetical protein
VPDSITTIDPKTGEEHTIANDQSPHFEKIRIIRFLEEWTFDPATLTTKIQIEGISPVREVYGDDSVYRGTLSLFWLKYADQFLR